MAQYPIPPPPPSGTASGGNIVPQGRGNFSGVQGQLQTQTDIQTRTIQIDPISTALVFTNYGFLTETSNSVTFATMTNHFFFMEQVPLRFQIKAWRIQVVVAAASSSIALALYQLTKAGDFIQIPNSQVTLPTTSTGTKTATYPFSVTLRPGITYFIGLSCTSATVAISAPTSTNAWPFSTYFTLTGQTAGVLINKVNIKSCTGSGATPSPFIVFLSTGGTQLL